MEGSPNILLIITDQHRADHLGCYGNPIVQTPNIDGIAARGTAFDRFYVATPICMPNRATLLTGRMPSLHGVRHNGIPLPFTENTFVEMLAAAGYHTALIGKSHLQNMLDAPPMIAETREARRAVTPGFTEATKLRLGAAEYEQETPAAWRDPDHRIALPHYGFQHVEYCGEHGDLVVGDYSRWLAQRCQEPDRLRGPENARPPGRYPYNLPQAWRTSMPEKLHPTSYVAERTIAFIEKHGVEEQGAAPFFLQCSFPDPHHPFAPPGRYWDMYDPRAMHAPPTCRPPGPGAPPPVRFAHAERAAGRARLDTPAPFAIDEREAREAIALTYGMITMIDDAVGRILAALAAAGRDGETIVIFTSDHGDFMGDHGLLLKGPLHYQGLIRVPFIWSDPTQAAAAGGRSAALSGTLDIADTILDRVGLAAFNGMQGRSLLAATRGDAVIGRDDVLIEEDGQRIYLGFPGPTRARTLVTRSWRLSLYEGAEWGELYDLAADPQEATNLWGDARYAERRSEMTERLARKVIAGNDRSPRPTRIA
jgi:arylsulfatase A-like enzyme